MSTENNTQRVAIVTGASRGIGKSIAKQLASDGFTVALVARDQVALVSVQEEIEASGGCAVTHVCDLAEKGSISSVI